MSPPFLVRILVQRSTGLFLWNQFEMELLLRKIHGQSKISHIKTTDIKQKKNCLPERPKHAASNIKVTRQGPTKTVGALDGTLFYLSSYLYDHSNTSIFTCDIKYLLNRPEAAGSHSTTHKEHDASHFYNIAVRLSRIAYGELVTKYYGKRWKCNVLFF